MSNPGQSRPLTHYESVFRGGRGIKRRRGKNNARLITVATSSVTKVKMAESKCRINVVLDLSFESFMKTKQLKKCVEDVFGCYLLNRRVENPVQLHLTSFKGGYKNEIAKRDGYSKWDIYFHDQAYTDVFKKEDIIYLTSESENVITTLDDKKVYVIGALMDHNRHKGLCLKLAEEKNIQHARFPINQYIGTKRKQVLRVERAFQLLLCVTQGKSWIDAVRTIFPFWVIEEPAGGTNNSQTTANAAVKDDSEDDSQEED